MPELLFIYGTLHPDRAPAEIAGVVRQLAPLGTGTIRARMHRFSEYPAIKIDTKNGSRISGHVFQVPDEAVLRQIDEYEDFYPAEIEKSLFQRKPVRVRMTDGSTVQAWVYEYNRQLPRVDRAVSAKSRPSAKRKTGSVPVAT